MVKLFWSNDELQSSELTTTTTSTSKELVKSAEFCSVFRVSKWLVVNAIHRLPVWPDVSVDCSPNYSLGCPKSSHSSFHMNIDVFQNSPKSYNTFGLVLKENLYPWTFKNRPIWSRCRLANWRHNLPPSGFNLNGIKIEVANEVQPHLPPFDETID